MTKSVTVFGATGAQGAPVVDAALAAGLKVRAVARDAARIAGRHPEAEPFAADLDDEARLELAFSGIDAAFVHLPMPGGPGDAPRWLATTLAAAERAALPLLVFSTSSPAGGRYPSSTVVDGSTGAARAVLAAATPAIVLQPTLYLENLLPEVFVPRLQSEGILDYPPLRATQRVSWTSHLDQATIAVAALLRPDLAGQAFDIASRQPVTGDELATLLTPWVGRNVSFDPLSAAAFGQRVGDALGAPGAAIALSDLYATLATMPDNALVIDTDALEATFAVTLTRVAEHITRWAKR